MTYLLDREPPHWLLEDLDAPWREDPVPVDPDADTAWSALGTFALMGREQVELLDSLTVPGPVRWDIPGLRFGDARSAPALPAPSAAVREFADAAARVMQVDPIALLGVQALVDAEVLLAVTGQLRVHNLHRIGDVHSRQLSDLVEVRATSTWITSVAPDTDGGDLPLAKALKALPVLRSRLDAGLLSLRAGKQLQRALTQLRPHLDRVDGLIDGQPANEVIPAVVGHVVGLIAESRLGLKADDPLLAQLQGQVAQITAEGGAQHTQLEKAFVLLAEHMPGTATLKRGVDELVAALLPSDVEAAAERTRARSGLTLTRKADNSGFIVKGELTADLGELLHTCLLAEARRDPANAEDTINHAALRAAGIDVHDPTGPFSPDATGTFALPDSVVALQAPRTRARKLHDALTQLLERYLAADLAGMTDKAPVRVTVAVTSDLLEGTPGARQALGASGVRIHRSLLARLWCNAVITPFLLTAGWIALGTAHTQRTLTATERTALDLQSGGHRCAGHGCCPGQANPLAGLEPHHTLVWNDAHTTSLGESIWACPTLHHDLHHGRTVLLRNGRRLNAQGWVS